MCIFYIIFVCNRLLYSNLYAIVSCTLFSLSVTQSAFCLVSSPYNLARLDSCYVQYVHIYIFNCFVTNLTLSLHAQKLPLNVENKPIEKESKTNKPKKKKNNKRPYCINNIRVTHEQQGGRMTDIL